MEMYSLYYCHTHLVGAIPLRLILTDFQNGTFNLDEAITNWDNASVLVLNYFHIFHFYWIKGILKIGKLKPINHCHSLSLCFQKSHENVLTQQQDDEPFRYDFLQPRVPFESRFRLVNKKKLKKIKGKLQGQ